MDGGIGRDHSYDVRKPDFLLSGVFLRHVGLLLNLQRNSIRLRVLRQPIQGFENHARDNGKLPSASEWGNRGI